MPRFFLVNMRAIFYQAEPEPDAQRPIFVVALTTPQSSPSWMQPQRYRGSSRTAHSQQSEIDALLAQVAEERRNTAEMKFDFILRLFLVVLWSCA